MAADSIVIQPTQGKDPSAPAEGTASQSGNTQRVTVSSETPAPKADTNPIPEKFRTADGRLNESALLQAYGELEKKLGGGEKKDTTLATPTQTPTEPPKGISQDDLTKLSQEFRDNGKLSDETYRGLEAKGITRQIADDYIAGQTARAAQWNNTLAEHVGGKAALDSLIEWAGANLTADQITEANKDLSSGNAEKAKLTLDGLKARYTAANGTPPNLVSGAESSRSSGLQPFQSNDELVAAMADPRYKSNETYRKGVYERLKVTK